MSSNKICPNCGKKLRENKLTRQWECSKTRTVKEKRFGCGYINKQKQQEL